MNQRKLFGFLLIAVFSFGLVAFGANQNVSNTQLQTDDFGIFNELGVQVTEDANNDARVRVAHLVPDALEVDVLVNGTAVLEDVPFKAVSDYIPVAPGTYNFTVVLSSDGTTKIFDPVITTLDADTDYSVAAVGTVAVESGTDIPIEPLLMVDDNSPVPSDQARVRVVHASPDAPSVDVNVSVTTGLLSDVPFKGNAYLPTLIDADTIYDIGVYVADSTTLALDLSGSQFDNGTVTTVFAVNEVSLIEALVVEDANADAGVRVTHAVPDAPTVDVLVNGSTAFDTVGFTQTTEYADLDFQMPYNFTVIQTGTSGPAVFTPVETGLASSTDYTIAAVGNLSTIEPIILADDNSPVDAGDARVRVAHLSPNAPAVDITLADGTVLVSNLAFKEAGYIEVAAGTYDLQVRAAGTNTVVLDLAGTVLEEGSVYSVFAMGYLLLPQTVTETVIESTTETITETVNNTVTEVTTTTETADGSTETVTETETQDAPGFGLLLVLLSFSATVVLVRRFRN